MEKFETEQYFSEEEKPLKLEKIEISEKDWQVLKIISQRVGGDFRMEVKLGEPGGGSFFNPDDGSITFDPLQIIENPDQAKFIAGHEGSHRAITPHPKELGLSPKEIEELYSQIGFGYLQNAIEDPAVNDWMKKRFPGLKEYVEKTYNEQFKEENVVLSRPEVKKIAVQLGYWPRFVQYGSEVIRDWHQKRFSKELDPAVEKALQRTINYARESINTIPDPQKLNLEKKEIISAGQKRFENNTKYIWPEVKKLVEMDLHTEEQRQMLKDFEQKQKELEQKRKEMEQAQKDGDKEKQEELQKEIEELEKELDSFKELPEDAKKELEEQIDKAVKEATEKLNKEIEEKQRQQEEAKRRQEELEKEIKELEEILRNPKKILQIIKEETLELKKKYGDERKTKVVQQAIGEFKEEDLIAQQDVVIMMSQDGYIKAFVPETIKAQKRGGKGIIGFDVKEEDKIQHVIAANTHDNLLFLTTQGKVFQLRAFEVPIVARTARGKSIFNFIELPQNEKIAAIVNYPAEKKEPEGFLVMVTKNGIMKKTPLSDFLNVRRSGLIAIKLKDDDELKDAKIVQKNDELIVLSAYGQALRFPEKDLRPMGRAAAGVLGIKLKKEAGNEVRGFDVIKPDLKTGLLLVVTEKGFGKKTALKEYRLQHRGGQGIKTAKITEKTGKVVAIRVLDPEDKEVLLISKNGILIKTDLSNISQQSRVSQGVRLIRLEADDLVAGIVAL